MYTFECGHCRHEFKRKEAICEDWRDPKKKLICPNCNTALKELATKDYFSSKQYWLRHAPGVIPAFFIGIGVSLGRVVNLGALFVIMGLLLIPFVLFFLWLRKFQSPFILEPYEKI